MDGTLLDLAFDTWFWLQIVPEHYGSRRGLSASEALKNHIEPIMRKIRGTLPWYCLRHWSEVLQIDLAGLQAQHTDRICWLPGATEFLAQQRAAGRRLVLATNAHPDTLQIKDRKLGMRPHFDAMYHSHAFGAPKEQQKFWQALQRTEGYDPQRCAFIDDNPEVLQAAVDAGIGCVIAVTHGDSSQPPREPLAGVPALASVAQLVS